jgi:hypothetical protein
VSAQRHPIFESLTLDAVAAAFHRRGKAIRYQGDFSITRKIDAGDERLDIDHRSILTLSLRLSAWATGEWWFLACQRRPGRNGGWLFKHELRGELGGLSADAIVKAFQDSMQVAYWPALEQFSKLQEVWRIPRPTAEA